MQPALPPINIFTGDYHFADCGAGIGRVSQELLLRYYHRVDVLEQSPKLMKEALYRLPKAAVRKHFLEPLQVG